MGKPDLCDWWTPERIAEEDAVWQSERRYVQYAQRIREVCDTYDLDSILEIGCGMGYIAGELEKEIKAKHLSYTGSDGSMLMASLAKKRHPFAEFLAVDIRNRLQVAALPQVDLVCSFAVLKHFSVTDWPAVLTTMLACGTYAVIQVQIVPGPSIADNTYPDINHIWINEQDLLRAVAAGGHVMVARYDKVDVSQHMANATEYLLLTRRIQ